MHELFDHTADLGIRATATDIDSLFAEMAAGLVEAMIEDPSTIRPNLARHFTITGTDREFLLFDLLKGILTAYEAENLLFATFAVRVGPEGLTATAHGEPHDPARHTLTHEVKAITYHELKVVATADGWLAEVIVDI